MTHAGAGVDSNSDQRPNLDTRWDGLLADRSAVVGVIGLGYVGLPLSCAFHDAGLRVVGFDNDPAKIAALRAGRAYIDHPGRERIEALAASGRFEPTDDPARLGEPDALLICLPTPIGRHQEPDLSFVVNAGSEIGRSLRAGQLIVLESTTYPGTTRGDLAHAIAAAAAPGLTHGRDYLLAYSPEREDPGSAGRTTRAIPKLVGGLDERSTRIAARLYGLAIDDVVEVSSAEVAEAAKLLENVFRAVNIALANEMKVILSKMGIDVWEVIAAASTKPFGFMPFYPGPGLGGHCIPVDPFYLAWKAREVGEPTKFIELAGEINRGMPARVVDAVGHALNARSRPLRGSRVLVLGAAYKPNVDDIRESPAAEIITRLRAVGADVAYHDPHVPVFPSMRNYAIDLSSVPLTVSALQDSAAVVVVTDHDAIDWPLVAEHAPLIVDTRNAIRRHVDDPPGGDRLVQA
ncbi:MAG: nucleotide sugar dehydrogenase [Planctomycetota bacterium]